MTHRGGCPPRVPGGCIGAVTRHLTNQASSIRELCKATGYAEGTVETAITQLRKEGSELAAKVYRSPRRDGPREPRIPYVAPEPLVDTSGIVELALSRRSDLESVW